MKLGEALTLLQKLSDGGKNDNLDIGVVDREDMYTSIKTICIDKFYPFEEKDRFVKIRI